MLSIGGVALNSPALLAPMSGITDRPFRRLIRLCNPGAVGLFTSEFISAEALWHRSERSVDMMRSDPDEHPFAVQLFGRSIERMIHAAKIATDRGAQIIDVNCGCPAPKVNRRGGGAALMKEPEHLCRLIEAMVRALDVPVTVKLRSGWDEDSTNALAVGIGAQNAGAAAVTLHPRSRKKLYSGTADWGLVTELAKHLTIPVIGSGDIISPEDERAVFASSGAAGFMIGRGALHNPFIFSELAAARNGMRRPEASEAERLALLHQYADLLAQDLPSRAHLGRMKNFANRMTVRWSDAALRRSLLRSATVPELLEQARRGFAQRAA